MIYCSFGKCSEESLAIVGCAEILQRSLEGNAILNRVGVRVVDLDEGA